MNARFGNEDGDEVVEEAAEQAERASQERREMARKASLAGAADDVGDRGELKRESDAHGEAADEREARSSARAHDGDGD
jgi:hypothetical protein